MTIVDVVIVLLLGAAALVGFRQGAIKQASVAAGVITALLLASLLFVKLAFLSEQSGVRTIVLFIITLAAALLCYDLFAALGKRLQVALKHRRRLPARLEHVGGAVLAPLVLLGVLWLGNAMFSSSVPGFAQSQVAHSRILLTLDNWRKPPTVFVQVSHVLEPFSSPAAFVGVEPKFAGVDAITQQYTKIDSVTADVSPSVVKVESWGCGMRSVGTGFVAADRTIVTNAHVVSGATRMSISDKNGDHLVEAIWFDPKLDVAVLSTADNLYGKALPLVAREPFSPGAIAAFLGYTSGESLTSDDAVILQILTAKGYDIYGQSKITRTIYAFRSTVKAGDSGGPLLTVDGTVAGLVFGHSNSKNKTGYAITASQIAPVLKRALSQRTAVGTGSCGA